jgi:hypothetical protein
VVEFQVVYGSVAASDTQISILSRSILEVLVDLSSFITLPEAHVADWGSRPHLDIYPRFCQNSGQ